MLCVLYAVNTIKMVDNSLQIEGNDINLDALNKETKKNSKSIKQESVIWKVNSDNSNVDFWYLWSGLFRTKHKKIYWKYNWFLFFFIILFGLIWWCFFKYDKFILDYSNWIESSDRKVFDLYEKTKKSVYNILWKEYEISYSPIDLWSERWMDNLKELINSDISYVYKKETLKNSVNNLLDSMISNANHLDDTKKYISTYWFFSDKLSDIITQDESITSIKDSMSAIESIKFSSAISVFSKLDTFLDSLSREMWMEKSEVLSGMNQIIERWEKDINLYIKNCYLNASEIDFNCNTIGDFNRYYELTQDLSFNVTFFKKLLQFIEEKLEQTEIPSFSIKFKWFDPNSKLLTFDIEINTFKEDEVELAKAWILSSHSFILNSLVNNLKLSRVIVSEPIEIRSIVVNQRILKFWNTEFTVNTSSNSFTVPIKKDNQIEIDDFVY